MTEDLVEKIIADALDLAGIIYTRDQYQTKRLDFFIPSLDLYIECKMFHSARISEQMSRVPNIIAIQGIPAAKAFAAMINAG